MYQTSPFHIDIPKRTTCCVHGQEEFSSGMEIHSTLQEDKDTGKWIRKDYCAQCWDLLAQKEQLPAAEPIRSAWRSKIPEKKTTSPLPKQRDERAMYLLREALTCQEPEDQAEAFVLALYLSRKRLLLFRQDILLENDCKASIYEIADTGETFCVKKLSLPSLHIEKIQENLAKKFR